MEASLPSGLVAQAALRGEKGAWVESAGWTLRRAAILWLGMTLFGERKDTAKRALAGSVGVEALVFGYVALAKDPTLPSGEAAVESDLASILATYAARSGVIALSMHLAGYEDNLWRNALAGAAAIELSVLLWAAKQRHEAAEQLPAYIVR